MLVGDAVKTSTDGRGVLEFFNGTKIRLDNDTEVVLTDITKRNDVEKIGITVNHGSVWIQKMKSEGVDQSTIQIRTAHMLVPDAGTVLEVESNAVETVRVIKGNLMAQILDGAQKDNVLDTIPVGVGQEMNLDEAVLKAFKSHETPSVLMALSDAFKLTDWYLWNMREDVTPSDFSQSRDLQNGMQPTQQVIMTQQVGGTQITTQQAVPPSTFTTTLETPKITAPANAVSSTDQNKLTIQGTVTSATAKVLVRKTVGGATDEYFLSKYKEGDLSFAYNVSEALGNFKAGENSYSFYAIDANGKKSDSADVKITYNKAAVTITDALTAPLVAKFNGSSNSTVTVGVVKVEGTVAGAEKMVINDFQLGKFVSGDKTWTYFANENGDNLKPGANNYEAYAVDAQGNKSAITKFTITYNKPATTPTSTPTSTSSGTVQVNGEVPGNGNGF